jgi:integrase/recombinase XerD
MTLSHRELRGLEDAASTERDRLILRVLAETGLRVGELCSLTTGDIARRDDRTFLRIHGKGNTRRLVPVAPDTALRIARMAHGCQGSHLFRSQQQTNGALRGLTPAGVRQMVRRIARRAGMTRRVHPHLFRHTFATEALRCGMDSVQLATILGHSGVAMIEKVYAHLTADDAYDAIIAMRTVAREANRRPIPSRPRGIAVRMRPQRRRVRHAL